MVLTDNPIALSICGIANLQYVQGARSEAIDVLNVLPCRSQGYPARCPRPVLVADGFKLQNNARRDDRISSISFASRPNPGTSQDASQAKGQTPTRIRPSRRRDADNRSSRHGNAFVLRSPTSTTAVVIPATAQIQTKAVIKTPVVAAQRKAECPQCGESMLKKTLPRHIRAKHNQSDYRCLECDLIFTRKDSLVRHQAERHCDDIRLIQCCFCNAHIRRRAMNDHLKSQACDAAYNQSLMRAYAAAFGWPGRFDAATVLDPLFISLRHGFEFLDYNDFDDIPASKRDQYWKLRALAVRTTRLGLNSPSEDKIHSLALALLLIADYDCSNNSTTEYRDLLMAVINLERRFNQTLIHGRLIQRNSAAYNIIMDLTRAKIEVLGIEEESIDTEGIGQGVESAQHFLDSWPEMRKRIVAGDFRWLGSSVL